MLLNSHNMSHHMTGQTLPPPPPPPPGALAMQATMGLKSYSQPSLDHFWKDNDDFEEGKQ